MVNRYVAKRNGRYAKLGGSETDEISEATVLGWIDNSNAKWKRYHFELIPVTIVPTDRYDELLEIEAMYNGLLK